MIKLYANIVFLHIITHKTYFYHKKRATSYIKSGTATSISVMLPKTVGGILKKESKIV